MLHRLASCFLFFCGCLMPAGAALSPAAGDPILAWDALMLDAIRVDNSAPTLASRNLAILHAAMFDAVNSIREEFQPYIVTNAAPLGLDASLAAASAARVVLSQLYPPFQGRIDDLYSAYSRGGEASARSQAWGEDVAHRVLEARIADGAATAVPYIPSDLPGEWRRTPPFFRPPVDPHWGSVKPFVLENTDLFLPPGPPGLESAEYSIAWREVRDFGGRDSAVRTAEQTQVAQFWSDFSYTETPPGHWHDIAASIAVARTNTISANARLFALMSLAHADAAIVCWAAKYRENFWRPVTAIGRADADGNSATEADGSWNSFLLTPSFPEYVSGHSTFSKAAAVLLARFFGKDEISFTARSDALPGVTRSFASFSECANEIGQSRIYGGIHFQFSNRDGKRCGQEIAEYTWANWLQPRTALPMLVWQKTGRGTILRAHGQVGKSYTVESSSDLKRWSGALTVTGQPGGVALKAEPGPVFYRIRAE